MKKSILILLIACFCLCAHAQTKKSDSVKVKYDRFVKIQESDWQQFIFTLNEYKRLQMYDPITNDTEKANLFRNVEMYMKMLPTRVKIDSVKSTTK